MAVFSLAVDKPKILFYCAMMAIQNYGFHAMYYNMWTSIPLSETCDDMRLWIGVFAIDCFVESFCVLWMAMGGYTDDVCMFTYGWILHLVVALPYCLCTYTIPVAMFSDEGTACRETMGTHGPILVVTYYTHAALFMVYVRAQGPQPRQARAPLPALV